MTGHMLRTGLVDFMHDACILGMLHSSSQHTSSFLHMSNCPSQRQRHADLLRSAWLDAWTGGMDATRPMSAYHDVRGGWEVAGNARNVWRPKTRRDELHFVLSWSHTVPEHRHHENYGISI